MSGCEEHEDVSRSTFLSATTCKTRENVRRILGVVP